MWQNNLFVVNKERTQNILFVYAAHCVRLKADLQLRMCTDVLKALSSLWVLAEQFSTSVHAQVISCACAKMLKVWDFRNSYLCACVGETHICTEVPQG